MSLPVFVLGALAAACFVIGACYTVRTVWMLAHSDGSFGASMGALSNQITGLAFVVVAIVLGNLLELVR